MKRVLIGLLSYLVSVVLPLSLTLLSTGCKDTKQDCFVGKVTHLRYPGRGCSNIMEILKPVQNSEFDGLTTGQLISFELSNGDLKVGDIVFFKVIDCVEDHGFHTMECFWPLFVTTIELCNK